MAEEAEMKTDDKQFVVDDTVLHPEFGHGFVVEVYDGELSVDFVKPDDIGLRRVKSEVLTRAPRTQTDDSWELYQGLRKLLKPHNRATGLQALAVVVADGMRNLDDPEAALHDFLDEVELFLGDDLEDDLRDLPVAGTA
jgi:hypothetical protein